MTNGYQLPARPDLMCGREVEGFLTPELDFMPQIMSIPPKRILPIIFLPGVMGSNLRLKPERQQELGSSDNIAWQPDSMWDTVPFLLHDAADRQRRLDPLATEVDTYDPINNPTGDEDETADERHDAVKVNIITPLLKDDPATYKSPKSKEQKARERGWGEVYFDSYSEVLQLCEQRLNGAFFVGKLDEWWKQIIGVSPSKWQAHPQPALQPLTEDDLKQAAKGCWFPVHAMGYNWLESNELSAKKVAKRINTLIDDYNKQGYQCEKVIVVTHSMGGLVARGLIHPEMGGLQDKVLGMVHSVMPSIGAGTAYKRMRCGFKDSATSIPPKIVGNHGDEITAVIANSPAGLELLPSCAYGNNWLQVRQNGKVLKSLPQKGDPYEEIYKLRGKWYELLREEWINPAGDEEGGYIRTWEYLDDAKTLHKTISNTYHPCSYAHYGADRNHPAWHQVVWEIDSQSKVQDIETLTVAADTRQGKLIMRQAGDTSHRLIPLTTFTPENLGKPKEPRLPPPCITLLPAADAGDETVSAHSADHQLRSGKFKGIFRQTGYEHQASYQDERVLHSTLYSLVRIAQTMKWST